MSSHVSASVNGDDDFRKKEDKKKKKIKIPKEEDEKLSDTFCLPFRTSLLMATLLGDSIQQLDVLDKCNNELRIMKTMADMTLLRNQKYQIETVEDQDAFLNIDKKQLESNNWKLDKLFNDRKFISDVLVETLLDLAKNGCWHKLTASIKNIEDIHNYRAELIEEESKNKITRRELMKQLRHQRNQMKSTIYDADVLMNKLNSDLEDTGLNSEIRARYIDNWERARSEQHHQKITEEEAGPSKSIDYYQTRADQEQRVHSEVEILINICINEEMAKVDEWMNKYDNDIEEKDLQIAIMKNKYQDAKRRRKEMEETYADHGEMMKNWLKFKSDRQDAINYREKMTSSALIAQAWWRGLLVRLEMGPYKPQKKPIAKKK